MDLDPWLVSGDLVETDELWARSVVARLIIADEIRVKILRKVRTPHRWDGKRPSLGLLGHLGHLAEGRYRGRGHDGILARPAH